MNESILAGNSPAVTMTSLELVQFINNQRDVDAPELAHSDFLKKVPQVLGAVAGNFSSYYTASNGKKNPCYEFQKREACLMAMSYSYDLQAKVFDRMTALEGAQFAIPKTYAQAMRLAADQADQIEAQQAQLAIAAPKAAFVDQYVDSTGLKGFRQVAKLLKANEARLREFLIDKKIMYRLGGEWAAYQQHIDAGRFSVKTSTSEATQHTYTSTMFTPKGVEWLAGLWAVHGLNDEVAS